MSGPRDESHARLTLKPEAETMTPALGSGVVAAHLVLVQKVVGSSPTSPAKVDEGRLSSERWPSFI